MKAVVTGAAGFIGRSLVDALVTRGHTVVGIDLAEQAARTAVTAIQADLCEDDRMMVRALASADVVFHLAATPGVRDHQPDITERRMHNNVIATRMVVERVPPDIPLIVTSSSSIYGGCTPGQASAEDDPPMPRGGYALSKHMAEQECRRRVDRGGTVLVARPFTVVGEGQRPDMALSRWIRAIGTGEPLTIFGSLDRTRDLTDVRHVVQALLLLWEVGATGVVNVGTGQPHSLRQIVDAVGAALGTVPEVQVVGAAAEEVAHTRADTDRLRRLTGFVPRTDLADVVGRIVAQRARIRS